MANVSIQDVDYVAGLAKLTIPDTDKPALARELAAILSYVEQLDRLDTSAVEPMMHAINLTNVFREDSVRPSLSRADAFANSPSTDGEYFLVPRILDSSS